MRSSALALLLVAGCEGSLLGTEQLENLLGIAAEPADPAWQLRWYLGEGEGLIVSCELYPVADLSGDDIGAGVIEVTPPQLDPEAPPFWLEEFEYRWALALPVLVDREVYVAEELDEEFDNLANFTGVWGVAEDRAWLFWDGDAGAVADDLVRIDDEFDFVPERSDSWMGFLPEMVAGQGFAVNGIYPLTGEELDDIESGLLVRASSQLSDRDLFVWSGLAMGGFHTLEECQ